MSTAERSMSMKEAFNSTMIIMEKRRVKVSMSIQVRISSRLGRSSNIARIEIAAVAISMEITCGCMELLEVGLATGFSSEIGTKLRESAVGQAGGSCYSWAALSPNDSESRYSSPLRQSRKHRHQIFTKPGKVSLVKPCVHHIVITGKVLQVTMDVLRPSQAYPVPLPELVKSN